jgi:hypothetical protein
VLPIPYADYYKAQRGEDPATVHDRTQRIFGLAKKDYGCSCATCADIRARCGTGSYVGIGAMLRLCPEQRARQVRKIKDLNAAYGRRWKLPPE